MSMVPASEDFERLAVRWASSTAAKEYPNECEATRKDIDRRLSAAIQEWITE